MFKLQKCGIYLAPKILAYYQRKKKFTNASHEKKKFTIGLEEQQKCGVLH